MSKYRIVTDSDFGYKVIRKCKFLPIWIEVGKKCRYGTNSNITIEECEELIETQKKIDNIGKVVKEYE